MRSPVASPATPRWRNPDNGRRPGQIIDAASIDSTTAPSFCQDVEVAIVITCYSGMPYFRRAVESVLAQGAAGLSLVLHDNGCAPDYREVIESTAMAIGAVVVRTDVNRYGEGLRHDVLPYLASRYVAILHDDDFYHPDKIEVSLQAIDRSGFDYLFTDRHYVDTDGNDLLDEHQEVNRRPIRLEEFPHQHIADSFYRGLRLHFSALVITTDLARRTFLGDPFLPRITDSLFVQRLLLDRSLRGCAIPDKLTFVRVHGGNDMLYGKFDPVPRSREFGLLQQAESLLFAELIATADDDLLSDVMRCFLGIDPSPDEGRVGVLVRAALALRRWSGSKALMGTSCLHQAWRLDPLTMMDLVRRLTHHDGDGGATDANRLMHELYHRYVDDVAALLAAPLLKQQVEALSTDLRECNERRRLDRSIMRAPHRLTRWPFLDRYRVPLNDERLRFAFRSSVARLMAGRIPDSDDINELRRLAAKIGDLPIDRFLSQDADRLPDLDPELRRTLVAMTRPYPSAGQILLSPRLSVFRGPCGGDRVLMRKGSSTAQDWRYEPSAAALQLHLPGLEDPVTGSAAIELDGFYPVERPSDQPPFRWSGPSNIARIGIPIIVAGEVLIELSIAHRGPPPWQAIKLYCRGALIETSIVQSTTGVRVAGWLKGPRVEGLPFEVELDTGTTFSAGGRDERILGVAVGSLTMTLTRR